MGRKKRWKRVAAAFVKSRFASGVLLARRYLDDFPEDPYAWLVLGEMQASLMRFDGARRSLDRAARLLPPDGKYHAFRALGHLYREKGSLTAAERWYRKALELRPDHDTSEIHLGTCLWRQGKHEEARSHLERAVELDSESRDEAYFNLGGLHLAQERMDEAVECYGKALEIDPKYRAAKRALADLQRWRKLAGNKA